MNTLNLLKKQVIGMMKRNEYGSDFGYPSSDIFLLNDNLLFNRDDFSFFFSGRSALYKLLEEGILRHNWEKVFFPSYYCHEVVSFINGLSLDFDYYKYSPFFSELPIIPDKETYVIINVDFFGIKKANFNHLKKTFIIDDFTHNLKGIEKSDAHYCFGSLRKELPLPVGGFCYSPKKLILPVLSSNLQSDTVAYEKLNAMLLKKEYLEGKINDKATFMRMFENAENKFASSFTIAGLPCFVESLLFQLNITEILAQKKNNLLHALFKINKDNFLSVNLKTDTTGFGLILECKSEEEKYNLKKHLVSKCVYPAVLWPNQFNGDDVVNQGKLLFLHMDYRYSKVDVEEIINILQEFFYYG